MIPAINIRIIFVCGSNRRRSSRRRRRRRRRRISAGGGGGGGGGGCGSISRINSGICVITRIISNDSPYYWYY